MSRVGRSLAKMGDSVAERDEALELELSSDEEPQSSALLVSK